MFVCLNVCVCVKQTYLQLATKRGDGLAGILTLYML